jgi:hypothetical protein
MRMDKYVGRLMEMTRRQDRFTFDLRSECRIYSGIVCAYRSTLAGDHVADLATAMAHAWERDGIISGWRDPWDGKVRYDSSRVFTDLDQALRFARRERQGSVYNLNRGVEVPVDHGSRGNDETHPHHTMLPAALDQ